MLKVKPDRMAGASKQFQRAHPDVCRRERKDLQRHRGMDSSVQLCLRRRKLYQLPRRRNLRNEHFHSLAGSLDTGTDLVLGHEPIESQTQQIAPLQIHVEGSAVDWRAVGERWDWPQLSELWRWLVERRQCQKLLLLDYIEDDESLAWRRCAMSLLFCWLSPSWRAMPENCQKKTFITQPPRYLLSLYLWTFVAAVTMCLLEIKAPPPKNPRPCALKYSTNTKYGAVGERVPWMMARVELTPKIRQKVARRSDFISACYHCCVET